MNLNSNSMANHLRHLPHWFDLVTVLNLKRADGVWDAKSELIPVARTQFSRGIPTAKSTLVRGERFAQHRGFVRVPYLSIRYAPLSRSRHKYVAYLLIILVLKRLLCLAPNDKVRLNRTGINEAVKRTVLIMAEPTAI